MSFKEGDKVVCITSSTDSNLVLNKIYITESVFDDYIIVSELPKYIYNINRFISLLEYRKMKINKIKYEIQSRR